MRREIIFEPGAQVELQEAAFWYEAQQQGLGDEFEAEVSSVLAQIDQTPLRFRSIGNAIRKAQLKKFSKYSIYYYVTSSHLGVVAIHHGARDPEELKRRLK